MKRNLFTPTRTALAVGVALSALALGAVAEDLGKIKITFDKDVAARTNMPRTDSDTSELGVSFDKDVADRTNMGRQYGDVGTVTTAPDVALRERTNMGGVAIKQAEPPKAAAAAAVPATTSQ